MGTCVYLFIYFKLNQFKMFYSAGDSVAYPANMLISVNQGLQLPQRTLRPCTCALGLATWVHILQFHKQIHIMGVLAGNWTDNSNMRKGEDKNWPSIIESVRSPSTKVYDCVKKYKYHVRNHVSNIWNYMLKIYCELTTELFGHTVPMKTQWWWQSVMHNIKCWPFLLLPYQPSEPLQSK